MRQLALLCLLSAGVPAPAASRFSFEAVEFLPPESRLPEARAFVATAAAPGTPLAEAIRAMRHAGAHCGPTVGGVTRCISSRPIQRSDEDGQLGDVTWTVSLYADATGRIARASVERYRAGL